MLDRIAFLWLSSPAMRIIMIGQKGLPAHQGGVERHVDDLAMRLAQNGHDVIAYCRASYALDTNIPASYRGVRCVAIPTLATKHLETVVQTFFASIHALFMGADIIHYHGIGPSLFAWIPRIFGGKVRVIATFHCQDYFHQKWGIVARAAFHIGEVVACTMTHTTIAVSKTLQDYIKKTYGRNAAYIPNAVPPAVKMPAKQIRAYGLSRGNYLLLVSRLVRHKNIHLVIQAYQQLAARNQALPPLVIVGSSCHTDEYARELKDRADGNPNIVFLGEQSGSILAELYSNARLFIHASASEGLSYALLEAMSYGCPVLVSDIAENKEVLHTLGTTFKNNDLQDCSAKLATLLSDSAHDETRRSEQINTIQAHYNIETIFQKELSLYLEHVAR